MPQNDTPMIVLTGGPCAGKTTVLSFLIQRLGELGFTVFTVPEVATLMLSNGIRPKGVGLTEMDFQRVILENVLAMENNALVLAEIARRKGKKMVIICDRGALDGRAYMESGEFARLAELTGEPVGKLLGSRYLGVIHLRSAAVGVPEAYNYDNPSRRESPSEAVAKDEKVCQAWCGHPHLRIVPASADFGVKLQAVLDAICSLLGVPTPIEIEHKFLLSDFDPSTLPVSSMVEIEQYYLPSPRPEFEEHRIRRRIQEGVVTHFQATKVRLRPTVRLESEYLITSVEYERALRQAGPNVLPIRKNRYCFVFDNQYFELDIFHGELEGLFLLEVELTREGQTVNAPLFLSIIREVTEDEGFSNYSLAKNGLPVKP